MKTVRIIGVRVDLGAGRRGVDMGPSALRKAGLRQELKELGYDVTDDGNIHVEEPEAHHVRDPKLKYLPLIASAMNDLAKRVDATLERDEVPLVLGGDHSIAIGTIAGVGGHFKRKEKKLGMIWIDAHGDANTPETTPSGNIHGMPQAIAFGRGAKELVEIGGFAEGEPKVDPESSCVIGVRSIDRPEKEVLKNIGIRIFTMFDIDRRGIYDVTREAIEIATKGSDGFHVSFDVDGMDPSVAPGVGTPVLGGLSYRETHTMMELIAETKKVVSMEVAEVNPILDIRNVTAEVAVKMVASAFGKRIL
jgi:arginase